MLINFLFNNGSSFFTRFTSKGFLKDKTSSFSFHSQETAFRRRLSREGLVFFIPSLIFFSRISGLGRLSKEGFELVSEACSSCPASCASSCFLSWFIPWAASFLSASSAPPLLLILLWKPSVRQGAFFFGPPAGILPPKISTVQVLPQQDSSSVAAADSPARYW